MMVVCCRALPMLFVTGLLLLLCCCGCWQQVEAGGLYKDASSSVVDLNSISQLNALRRAKKLTIIGVCSGKCVCSVLRVYLCVCVCAIDLFCLGGYRVLRFS